MRARRHLRCAVLLAITCAIAAQASPNDPDAALRAFRASDFGALERELGRLADLRNGTQDESQLFEQAIRRTAKAIALDAALTPRLEAWEKARPRSARPALVRAQLSLRQAWLARGEGMASTVPAGAWPIFRAQVQEAEAQLEAGLRRDPRDLQVATLRIETALLGSGDPKQVATRFEAAIAIDPASLPAHRAMLRALSPAWLGTHEGAIAFARNAVRRHPEAPGLGVLLVDAHLAAAFDEDPTPQGIARYVRVPEVWRELSSAMERYVGAHPADPWGHNRYAWLAWRGGQRALAIRELDRIDGDYREDAWLGDFSPQAVRLWALASPPASRRP